MSTLLVVGSTGLLGPYLLDACRKLAGSEDRVLGAARAAADVTLDATDPDACARVLQDIRPRLVVHAVGLTNVDACRANPERARAVNAGTVANLVCFLPPMCRLVYISSDQVYPDTAGPHREEDAEPVNEYGLSKLAGEAEALKHPRALVLRTNIFGPSRTPGRTSLSDFVVDNLSQGKPVTLFEDIFFSPLHMESMANWMVRCIEAGLDGVFNLGSREGMSKKEFAMAVAAHKNLSTATASSGSGVAVPGRDRRPRDMRLDLSRIEAALGTAMPTLQQEVELL